MNRNLLATALLGGAALLSGCATLGGTVKGDFACRAPTGTCAPMTAIDAAAIRTLAGEGAGTEAEVRSRQPSLALRSGAVPVRTGERMLTILLPAHVDEADVLHDAATVHAVVEEAGWTFAAGSDLASNPEFSRSSAPSSLREAVAGASAPAIEGLETLPARAPQPFTPPGVAGDGPSAVAIAAARSGHRVAGPTIPQTGTSAVVAPIPNAAPATLPPGKVVLPQGDPAATRARLRALAAPQLPKLGQPPIAGDPDAADPAADDPADPSMTLPRQELPR
ncbi:TraV family lipoprotein [Sphingomonas profundi]|uniref:TraV family lipoprotein n=1 Tax=Alterirhizorhabdus profundi TaxID=2681549 RepID=UPI0012E9241E|nr:TraV family lipoprotein [Sphingomonas profundi]